jgi:pimeloyl-ACP methyl ester carboxylesterase
MLTVFIHGATATAQSFNYIRELLRCQDLALEYDSENGFHNNLDEMSEILAKKKKDNLFFVGHSLGGIYALSLAERFEQRTLGGLTISTPYGGSEIAPFLKHFVPFNRLLKEIGPDSEPIRHCAEITLSVPWCNIVTTRGNSPWIGLPNDGVVSLESQRSLSGIDLIELSSNHYEVLMDNECVQIIQQRRQQAEIAEQMRNKK